MKLTGPRLLPLETDYVYDGVLMSSHDADTYRLEIALGLDTYRRDVFRMLGVQAPEVAGPGVSDEEEAAGRAAHEYLRSLIEGVPLTVQTEKDAREGRGRYLVSLWRTLDGLDVAWALVEAGHAVVFDGKGKVPKWLSPDRWLRSDGAIVGSKGNVIA